MCEPKMFNKIINEFWVCWQLDEVCCNELTEVKVRIKDYTWGDGKCTGKMAFFTHPEWELIIQSQAGNEERGPFDVTSYKSRGDQDSMMTFLLPVTDWLKVNCFEVF